MSDMGGVTQEFFFLCCCASSPNQSLQGVSLILWIRRILCGYWNTGGAGRWRILSRVVLLLLSMLLGAKLGK